MLASAALLLSEPRHVFWEIDMNLDIGELCDTRKLENISGITKQFGC